MRHRDFVGYKQGVQVSEKMIVIRYLGWSLGGNGGKKINVDNLHTGIEPINIPKGKSGRLWYTMFDQTKPLPLPFISERKKTLQFNIHPLAHLQPQQFYVVWCANLKESDGPGEWIWTHTLRVTQQQARNIFEWKRTLYDVDKWHPRNKIALIAEFGGKIGTSIWQACIDRYNTEKVKPHEVLLVIEEYEDDFDDKYFREIQRKLRRDRIIHDLMEF